MKKEKLLWLLLLAFCFPLVVMGIGITDANEIIEKIDHNMSSKNRIFESSMLINGKRSSRTITLKTWSVGYKKSFTEYLSPASEKGTKMLKLESQLWIYSPSTDRTIQISGHMLRQSVMGSDLSYEDMMEDRKLTDLYNARIIAEEKNGDRDTWILELKAKTDNVAYYLRKIWVDKERFVPLKEELFAKSGQILKRTELKDIRKVQGRWFPFSVLYKDMLKEGNGTEFKISDIKFDQDIPDYIFTKAALKK
ncbi:MAG: outer membrane lipoprotein-sorting protein [Bacteroidota bacterium]|nr:outer membrane lipoprotein-sorting protein [Bacteroidota bacterium]